MSLLVIAVLAASLAQTRPVVSQGTNAPLAIDLATVPVPTTMFPERGYQMAQAGDLEFGAIQASWAPEGVEDERWGEIAQGYQQGHSQVQILLSDRADSRSEPLATVTTIVIGLDSADAAGDAVSQLLDIAGYDDVEDVNGVSVHADDSGVLGAQAVGEYVVTVRYAPAETQGSTRQNTTDWTPESIADLVIATSDQLNAAIARADLGAESFGVANVMVFGLQAPWTLPWPFYPSTEHYRVRDGETVPYAGELEADAADVAPSGIAELFVSRQQIGDENYAHLIDVTLAQFETESAAEVFARSPQPVAFPPTWEFAPTYTLDNPLPDGLAVARVQVDGDFLRASGYRTVRQKGSIVQVVQWVASGSAVVSREAIAWLTEAQSACLDALPEPCAPIYQDDVPAALSEHNGAETTEADRQATPAASNASSDRIASDQFGWAADIPDDGWELVATEAFTNSDYHEFQSGRSLLTLESVVDHHGDPQQCVLDNLALLEALEERAVIEIGSDDPDERPAGLEQGHGWAVYTVEPLQEERADQEYTVRYDCFTLAPGDSSLVVTHIAPRDLWTAERDKGDRFREGIQLPDATAAVTVTSHSTPLAGDGRYFEEDPDNGLTTNLDITDGVTVRPSLFVIPRNEGSLDLRPQSMA